MPETSLTKKKTKQKIREKKLITTFHHHHNRHRLKTNTGSQAIHTPLSLAKKKFFKVMMAIENTPKKQKTIPAIMISNFYFAFFICIHFSYYI